MASKCECAYLHDWETGLQVLGRHRAEDDIPPPRGGLHRGHGHLPPSIGTPFNPATRSGE